MATFKHSYIIYALFLVFAVTGESAFAQSKGYCEGHPKKIINVLDISQFYGAVQNELNRYRAAEYAYNGRYEICLEMQLDGVTRVLELDVNQKLTVTNNSGKELVIGFLKAQRTDNSTTPILDIRGSNVTLFSPELSNVKKAVVLQGPGHKIIGGTIIGIANSADSLCVSGSGNKMEIKNLMIDNCPNAINLTGDENVVEGVSTAFSRTAEMPRRENYTDPGIDANAAFLEAFNRWRQSTFFGEGVNIVLNGQRGTVQNVSVDGFHGTGMKLLGSGHRVVQSDFTGEPIPEDLGADKNNFAKRSTDCLLISKSSNITLESNELSHCREGIRVEESQQITIGPEKFSDFETKHNKVHHNDYAVHAQGSQQVFAWHNSIFENGANLPIEDASHSGLWLESTNYLEEILLKEPILISAGEDSDNEPRAIPVVNYQSGNPFVEIEVPFISGEIEFSLISEKSASQELQETRYPYWYQPYLPLKSCSFSNTPVGANGYSKVKCEFAEIEVATNIGKKIVPVIHSTEAGTSPIAETVGVVNRRPSTIPSIPVSTPPVSVVEGGADNVGNAMAGGGGGGLAQAAGGGGKAASCSLDTGRGQTGALFPLLWYTLTLTLLIQWRRREFR